MYKRTGIIFLSAFLAAGLFSGCSNAPADPEAKVDKLSVVSTIFPPYDWVREIAGTHAEDMELTLLLDNGIDLHNYQPTADDIVKISGCDLFIYVGGESDGWVEDALASADNPDMQALNLMEVLGDAVKEEEVVEGMEAEEDHEDEDYEEEHPEYDEHVWLSLKNSAKLCTAIADCLGTADQNNADAYKANAEKYFDQLAALDAEYQLMVNGARRKTVLFGDRFPFRYLADDYGLDYYAAFVGCSAETEASFETIAFLADKTNELSLPAVMVIDGSDQSIAKAVINNTADKNQKVLMLDSMQSVTGEEIGNGTTYLSVMEENLKVLKEALN